MTRIVLALAVVALSSCSDSMETATSPTIETASLTTEIFTGSLPIGGQRFYAFSTPRDSAFSVLLGSLSTAGLRPLPDLQVRLGVGVPAGTGCSLRESVISTAGLLHQFRGWAAEGIHCVALDDIGELTEPVMFAIRISHY